MASVKLILRTNKKNEEGKHPIALQIIKNRIPSVIHLGYYLDADEWDKKERRVKKCHPNHARLNNLLARKLSEATDKVLEEETKKADSSVRALKMKIKPKVGETFFAQAKDYTDLLIKKKEYNIYSADNPRINKFREFLKGQDIAFSDITISLLESFKAYLKGTKNKREKYLSDRTVINHFVVIRSVYAHAKKNKQIIPEEHYPFGKGKFKIKFPSSKKIGLNAAEVKLLEDADLSDRPQHDDARNIWLIALYFAGTRVGDTLLLKRTDFKDSRLYYTMEKNDKEDSLKIPAKALSIIEKYSRNNYNHDLLFPDLAGVADINDDWVVQCRIKTRVRKIDKRLQELAVSLKIEKKLTMHIARHTFGNLSGNKIPVQMLQKLYRHSHISTTIGYQQNFIYEDEDAALDAVIGGKLV